MIPACNFRAVEDVGSIVTKERLREVWFQKTKANVDFSGNDFSTALSGESAELDINALRLFVAGGLGGLLSRTLTSPIERIRLLQQTEGKSIGSAKSILQQIIQKQGIKGVWQGNGAHCLKAIPQSAMVCLVYGSVISLLEHYDKCSDVSPSSRLAVGALAGAFATCATYPLDVIRAKLAVQMSQLHVDDSVQSSSGKGNIIHHSRLRGSNTPSTAKVVSYIRPKGNEYFLPRSKYFNKAFHIARIDDIIQAVVYARRITPVSTTQVRSLPSLDPTKFSLRSLKILWNGPTTGTKSRFSAKRTPSHVSYSSASLPIDRVPTRYQSQINPASYTKNSPLNGVNIRRLGRNVGRAFGMGPVHPLSDRYRGLVASHPHIVHSTNALENTSMLSRMQNRLRAARARLKFINSSGPRQSMFVRMRHALRGKRLAQSAVLESKIANVEYKGIRDTWRKIIVHEGLPGLYRGIKPTLVGMATFMAIQLAGFDVFVDSFHRIFNIEEQNPACTLLASSVAGTIAQTVIHPIDTVRRRIQVAKVRSPQRLGFWRISRSVISREGWRGLYSGLLSTYGKVVPSVTISLTVREAVLGRLQW